MEISVSILIITTVLNLLLGLIVYVRNPEQRANIFFLGIAVFVSLWTVTNSLTSSEQASFVVNHTSNNLAYLFAYLAVLSGVLFSYTYPVPQRLSRFMRLLIGYPSVIILLLCLTPLVAGRVSEQDGELKFTVGPLLVVYVVLLLCLFLVLTTNLVKVARRGNKRQRQQAKLLMIAFSIPILIGSASSAILPIILKDWQTASYGPLLTLVMVALISYSIVRHKLFNIRLIIARSLAYLLSIAVLLGLYLTCSLFVINTLFEQASTDIYYQAVIAFLLVIGALLFAPIKKFFDKLTNKLFYRDAYVSDILLDELSAVVVQNTTLYGLRNKVKGVLEKHLKTDFAVLIFREDGDIPVEPLFSKSIQHLPELFEKSTTSVIVVDELYSTKYQMFKHLEHEGVAAIIRLGALQRNGEDYGYVLLGHKKSGNVFTKQDINILHVVSNELVIAVQNALRFEEIEQFNVTLQAKVNEATRKLRSTNEKLEAMDETKDEFISMASHQLRTPLTSVKGYVSMVLEGDAGEINDMQRKLLEQAFTSSQRMVYLIADLLNLSRLRTGKFIIESTPTNLSDVIESEVEQLKETAKSRSLKLVYSKPKSFPTLMLDETKIRQVIMNFVDNAIYYTAAGGKIEIKLSETKESVEFTVHDNGIGVPKGEQHHLFNKFYRARNAQKARPDGTGLGLFMAKKVVVAQGGAIIFNSTEGKGSTFGFTFSKRKLLISEEK